MVVMSVSVVYVFFVKQKTAYEMRISDWSSDVCSSDLWRRPASPGSDPRRGRSGKWATSSAPGTSLRRPGCPQSPEAGGSSPATSKGWRMRGGKSAIRSEEHTSELQSLMRISYAVFCLKKKKDKTER